MAGNLSSSECLMLPDNRAGNTIWDGYDVEDVVTKSFEVRPGGTLYMELDYGNIEVEVGNRNIVEIEMTRKVRVNSEREAREILEDMHEYSFEKNRDDITIESTFKGKDSGRGADGIEEGRENLRFL